MSDYSSLKATINANIKANNNQEITGSIMNSVLNAMVNSLGAGYQFIGVATPTNPGSAQTPDYKCFYIATTPGTYTNLGGLVVADGEVALLKYDSSWTKEVTGIASADQINQLGQKIGKTEIKMVDGYIPCAVPNGTIVDINDVRIAGTYKHAIVPVNVGDVLTITANGGSSPKPISYLDAEYRSLGFVEQPDVQNYIVAVNSNTKYILINDYGGNISYYAGADSVEAQLKFVAPKVGKIVYVAANNSTETDKRNADYVCDGINDESEINNAIESLTKGGTIQLLDGDYYIDSFSKPNGTAIEFGYNSGNARVIVFKGTTQNKSYNTRYGVTVHVTETALNSCSDSGIYRVFSGTPQKPEYSGDFFTYTYINNVVFENFYLYFHNASKPIIGIYGCWFGSMELNQIGIFTESYFNDRFLHLKPATPHQNCCGIYTNSGSNDEMARLGMKCVYVGGLYTGFMFKGVDHLIMELCMASRCVYGYRFQEYSAKTLTMINCADEGNSHLPRFESNGGTITMIDFNMEINGENIVPDDINGDTVFSAKEDYPGSWKGTISFTMQGRGTRGISKFWADGSGINFITRNLYNPISSMPTNPEFLERYFDQENNVWKTWNGSSWV